ncbi:MAG TPA: ATP-binding protein, partial [Solirubrobacteraceae bacterium]|nr:ATP-binding protein [Solirubrobacteraceae bacterium]
MRTRPRHRWRPRWTLRLRLTLLYGGMFLVAGAVLLTITYELVSHSTSATVPRQFVVSRTVTGAPPPGLLPGPALLYGRAPPTKVGAVAVQAYAGQVTATFQRLNAAQQKQLKSFATSARTALRTQQSSQLSALLTKSGVALGIMAIVSIGLGWLMAGRALRPVRTMSVRARGISERNLHERLALDGPDDELKELGDTFDELLGRLESAFESQRQFVANASHELRTPITLERTLVEVALADPGADTDSLRGTCRRVLAASERQERLIEALLTLARSQRGLDRTEPLDLAAVTEGAVQAAEGGAQNRGLRVHSALAEAPVMGDPRLAERLAANLVDNAVRHNVPGGWVEVVTGIRAGRPILSVANTGPVIPPQKVDLLFQPFGRLEDRMGRDGLGLGLSIVTAIAAAHEADLRA